ncbi:hypothetical protein ENSA5_42830 [Enhygromyxa salina]|uniref:Secreted protein n=1 Tax=Enhygromyxa salina TaxID=215803 RepID=A0A2S9XKH7_9BACT|nr:hypothetical protein [Enhygromyxa salina]PRP93384.1 hypothetical protein ENSA5_42830 [Enhygromyxa salina]
MVTEGRASFAFCSLSLLGWTLAACTPAPGAQAAQTEEETEAKPEVVCKHVRDIAAKDTDDAQILDQVQRECVETLGKMRTRYQTFTTCLDLAGNAAAVAQCEEPLAKPRSLIAAASPTAKLELLCDHMLGLVKTELGEMASSMSAEEMQQLRDKCVSEAEAQIEVKGVEKFQRDADCILAAQTLKDVEACGL